MARYARSGWHGVVITQPREVIAMSAAVERFLTICLTARVIPRRMHFVPGLAMAALSFGHLPAIFVSVRPDGERPAEIKEKVRIRQLYAEGK